MSGGQVGWSWRWIRPPYPFCRTEVSIVTHHLTHQRTVWGGMARCAKRASDLRVYPLSRSRSYLNGGLIILGSWVRAPPAPPSSPAETLENLHRSACADTQTDTLWSVSASGPPSPENQEAPPPLTR